MSDERSILLANIERLKQTVNQLKNASQEDRIYSEQVNKLERDLLVIKNEKMQNEEMY